MTAVEALGYRPNLAARALAVGKTQIIAVVFPFIYDAVFTDPLTLRILEGIEVVCAARGYNILLSTPRLTSNGPDENYFNLIQSGYLDGVIALDNVPLTSVLEPVHKSHIKCVAIGYHRTQTYIHSDDFSGGAQVMSHILSQGHQTIGIIAVDENMNFSINRRLDGMRSICSDAGVDFEKIHKATGDFSVQSGAQCTHELLIRAPDITAIISVNDRMAMGAIQQARAMGRSIPDDLVVTGYDDIPSASNNSPSLTTVNQQAPELGQTAAIMLFDMFDGKTPDPVILPTRLIIRESSAKGEY
jgi:DNA-binding LacI/PurR family transcriptional regulator